MDKRMTERNEAKMTARVWERRRSATGIASSGDRDTHILFASASTAASLRPSLRNAGVSLDRAEPDREFL